VAARTDSCPRVRRGRGRLQAALRARWFRPREPSKRSLREVPEVDFCTARVKRNPYARRIAAAGLVVQVGRGRPKRLLESGGTTPRSVRFPDEIWALLERRAKKLGRSRLDRRRRPCASFNPHVSTGVAPREYLDKMTAEPFGSFAFSPAGAAVYQLGPFGTAAKKLKE